VAWGDYDNDDDLDLLLTGQNGSLTARVYRNDAGAFTDISATGVNLSYAAWGDYDNDGDLDILLTGQPSSGNPIAKIYKNTAGVFSDINAGLTGVYYSAVAWGDYDNDGDLDILLSGNFDLFDPTTKIYRNDGGVFNTVPSAPANLSQSIIGNSVTFSWDASTDTQTPSAGLTYNLMVGTTSNGVNINSPMADVSTGYRRVAQLGGTNHNESWTLNNLADGCYFWRVQAVDHAFAGSAFSAEGNFILGAPLAANAGLDQTINASQSVQIGGSPTASGGTPPYSYSWLPNDGSLDDVTALNPTASPASTTTYTVTVMDASGCTATDEVIVEVIPVKSFVFLADKDVTIDRNGASEGNIHANNDIVFKKGNPSTYKGDLTAVDDIDISSKNTIDGDATAGDEVDVASGSTVSGAITEDAAVAIEPLPSLSFTAGGNDISVPQNGTVTLAPGVYDDVTVNKKGTLKLSSGDYFVDKLELKESAKLIIDVGAGAVNINAVEKLSFEKKVVVSITPSGDAGSPQVTFTQLDDDRVTIGESARVVGGIIAVEAEVRLSKNSRFKGSICAEKIVVDQGTIFLPHIASTFLPKSSEVEESEVAKSEVVTGYELAQNYPNPFNPTTTISFQLPVNSNVSLVIYNINGQLVKRLVAGEMNAGYHSVMWDAKDDRGQQVASGVYLYVLKAGNPSAGSGQGFVSRRKLVLMK